MSNFFYNLLVATNLVKIKFSRVRVLYLRAYPEQSSCPDIDLLVVDMLLGLANEALIELPSKGRRSNWSGLNQRIPAFINVPVNRNVSKKVPVRAWHPKIAPFVTGSNKVTNPLALDSLVQLSRWFAKTEGDKLMTIPLRERAVEIFGNEKALDGKKNGIIYSAGGNTLTFDDIAAFYVPPPISWEAPEGDYASLNGLPILFIENSDTYYSFARWNQDSKRYAAVAYGKGNQISASIANLDWIHSRFPNSPLQYFGDLDREGVSIMQRANDTLAKEGVSPVVPAKELYWYLIDYGFRQDYEHGTSTINSVKMEREFGEDLYEVIWSLFEDGHRIAQENLSLDVLSELESMIF